jgi:acyl-CoA hydrolase
MDPKPVSASAIEFIRTMTQLDANLHGNVHGGVIMKEVDSAAGTAAMRHTGRKSVVTAAIDELSFLQPVFVGDILVVSAQVNYVGTTSMEVGVRVAAEEPATGARRHTTSAYLVMVALDDNDEPVVVPPLELTTDLERRRHEQAIVRRQIRTERRQRLHAMRGDGPPRIG